VESMVKKIGKIKQRSLARKMQRMGISMQELSNVVEVIIRTDSEEIVVRDPHVVFMKISGQDVYQVTGQSEKRPISSIEEGEPTFTISEEDIQLVAAQANVSFEEAKNALEQTNGDLAQAILLLKQKP